MAHPTDDRSFRLPLHVRPAAYDAILSVDLDARRFAGTISIELSLSAPASEIVLHATGLDVGRARLRAGGRDLSASEIVPKPASETIVLAFGSKVPAGDATLEIDWTGKMTEGLRGLYTAGDSIAATQFEAADARRVFPCFDEPGFKARWRLAVEAPSGIAVLSNGKPVVEEDLGDRRRVRFAETPPLPTYLVALVLGRLESPPEVNARGVPVRTFAQPAKLSLTGFAQSVAAEVLPRLEDYFGVPYAFGKLDQVGLPEFEAGAMENAGLITYREVALLLDPRTASLAQKKRVAEVVTHELAHQWFGNLVTMTWWDDLWLNEAFATWLAFKIVDQWNPAWRVWLEFDQGKAAAMQLDALHTTHPVRAEVRSVEEAGEAFDLITYEKGGGVLRMIEGYLGEERFRDGIRRYMRRHAEGNAVADDLWRALGEAANEEVLDLANSWIGTPGHPVVEVDLEGSKVALEQRRFFSGPSTVQQEGGPGEGLPSAGEGGGEEPEEPGSRPIAFTATWPVPIVLRHGHGDRVRERRFLLRDRRAEVALDGPGYPDFVVANGGATGFYRVSYRGAARASLLRNLPRLESAERISLLSDEWALLRAGVREVGSFLDLCALFSGESDYAVLDELVGRLAAVEFRLVADEDRRAFQGFVSALLRSRLEATGWDPGAGEEDATRLRRAAALRGLGLVGREARTTDEARARLDRWLGGDRGALEPNLHDPAVTIAARAGDAARFDSFRSLFHGETDPAFRRRWLLALASFERQPEAERGIELFFGDEVPLQETASFAAALLANRTAREPFFGRLRADWGRVEGRLRSAPMLLRRTVEAMGSLVERRQLEEAEAFLAAHPAPEARQATAQTLERLRQDVGLRERTQPAIGEWLGRRGAGG